mgnify:FL=1
MIQLIPLFSGSSGNAAYIGTPREGLLIDAGVSCRGILQGLEASGIPYSAVRGVLLTHDHSDHIKGLRVLCKRLGVPVYAACETLDLLAQWGAVEIGTDLIEICCPTQLAGMEVTPFDTPHDAAHSVGFHIDTGERKIGYATDLGTVTPGVWQMLVGCDLVMLEANYEPAMLRVSSYPYHLKQRIASCTGHLSNDMSARCIADLARAGTARFVLAHLSRENNTPEIAAQAVREVMALEGFAEGRDFTLEVARRLEPTPAIVF